jgi:hypothetical protein
MSKEYLLIDSETDSKQVQGEQSRVKRWWPKITSFWKQIKPWVSSIVTLFNLIVSLYALSELRSTIPQLQSETSNIQSNIVTTILQLSSISNYTGFLGGYISNLQSFIGNIDAMTAQVNSMNSTFQFFQRSMSQIESQVFTNTAEVQSSVELVTQSQVAMFKTLNQSAFVQGQIATMYNISLSLPTILASMSIVSNNMDLLNKTLAKASNEINLINSILQQSNCTNCAKLVSYNGNEVMTSTYLTNQSWPNCGQPTIYANITYTFVGDNSGAVGAYFIYFDENPIQLFTWTSEDVANTQKYIEYSINFNICWQVISLYYMSDSHTYGSNFNFMTIIKIIK